MGRGAVPDRMSLLELAGIFQKANAVIGVDTGLTHLAAAVGARTVGIYCGSDPALTGLHGSSKAANVGAAGRPPPGGASPPAFPSQPLSPLPPCPFSPLS